MESQPTLHEFQALKAKYQKAKKRIHKYQKRIIGYKKTIKNYRKGEVADKWKEIIVREKLKSKLSPGKIDILLSKHQRRCSKNWTHQDYVQTAKLNMLGGPKVVNYVRQNVIPLPSKVTLQQKTSFVRILPSKIIQPSISYLEHLIKSWTSTEHLAVIMFDEINLTNKAEMDLKFNTVIGY